MEDRVTLNYADTVEGDSAFMFWVILGDGSRIEKDEEKALQGSGSWLPVPSAGSQYKPIKLLISRSESSQQMRVAAVSLNVLYARRVVIVIVDSQGQVAAQHIVRSFVYTATVVVVLILVFVVVFVLLLLLFDLYFVQSFLSYFVGNC